MFPPTPKPPLPTPAPTLAGRRMQQACRALAVGCTWGGVVLGLLFGASIPVLRAQVWKDSRWESPSLHLIDTLYGAVGAEDIDVEAQTGFAFISSDNRRVSLRDNRPQGALFGLNLQDSVPHLRLLTPELPFPFHPHGLSVYHEPTTQEVRLFVINHRSPDSNTVEVFAWDRGVLQHLESIYSPLFRYPNDLAALDLNRFYLTNDRGSRTGLGFFFERLFKSRKSTVIYWNGAQARIAATRLAYANGIAVLPGGGRVVVSSSVSGKLHDYLRNPLNGELELRREVKVGKGLDNLHVDTVGGVWLAAHPKMLRFVGHAMDSSRRSPWLIYHIPNWEQPKLDIQLAAASNGKGFSGVSVATVWGPWLLLGSVFERPVLLGRVKPPIQDLRADRQGESSPPE